MSETALRIDALTIRDRYGAAVVRDETLQRYPELRSAIEMISGKLTDEKMRELNYAVDGKHRPVREVAAEFLASLSAKPL